MRAEFRASTKRSLAERAGHHCSNPDCRRSTVGPDADEGTANIGVAAHITAASVGGPRFDPTISEEERCAYKNGIWLCQSCSRLVDSDESGHSVELLHSWKQTAVAIASLELRGFEVRRARGFKKMEQKIPELVAEMREDLKNDPFVREFIAFKKALLWGGGETPLFMYYHDDHDHLLAKLKIMENYGAICNSSINDVPRFTFSEEFVEYLQEG